MMLTVTLTKEVNDPTGDTPLSVPAGTVVKVIAVHPDYLDVETLDGRRSFPVELDEFATDSELRGALGPAPSDIHEPTARCEHIPGSPGRPAA